MVDKTPTFGHRPDEPEEGPLGDVIADRDGTDEDVSGPHKPEPVEDRPMVGQVTPEDYPLADRAKG